MHYKLERIFLQRNSKSWKRFRKILSKFILSCKAVCPTFKKFKQKVLEARPAACPLKNPYFTTTCTRTRQELQWRPFMKNRRMRGPHFWTCSQRNQSSTKFLCILILSVPPLLPMLFTDSQQASCSIRARGFTDQAALASGPDLVVNYSVQHWIDSSRGRIIFRKVRLGRHPENASVRNGRRRKRWRRLFCKPMRSCVFFPAAPTPWRFLWNVSYPYSFNFLLTEWDKLISIQKCLAYF